MMPTGRPCCVLALVALAAPAASLAAPPMVLNEWNAVGSGDYLAGGSYKVDANKVDPYWASVPGMPDGRIEGNGGNWIELVVIADHLDIRGWQLRWAEPGATDTNGMDVWKGDASVEQGILTFSATAPLWSDLRAGTILTISEKHHLHVDTDWDGGLNDRNFTDGLDAGDPEVDVVIDLTTDTSYDPRRGTATEDWWIHVSSREEQAKGAASLLRTQTNVDGDEAGDFSVGPDDWELSIHDSAGTLVYGPIGENIEDFGNFPGGIDNREAGRLEADPDRVTIDNDDYDDVTSTTFGAANEWGGNTQDFSFRVPEPGTLALLAVAAPWLVRRRKR